MYRALVLKESLARDWPSVGQVGGRLIGEYPYLLDGSERVTVIEMLVTDGAVGAVIDGLKDALKPRRFYAHIVGATELFAIFPGASIRIGRGDPVAAAVAQEVGTSLDIPLRQMRFLEMFEVDHPDAVGAS